MGKIQPRNILNLLSHFRFCDGLSKKMIRWAEYLIIVSVCFSSFTGCQLSGFDHSEQETAGEERSETSRPPSLTLDNFLTESGRLDLAKLQEYNPECYAWLDIPDTEMSFPLMQPAEDLSWYLSHDFFGNADEDGCIYTEYYNGKDFGDPNTVIYGRNAEGRFGGLHQYQDRDFFDSHSEILIYTGDAVLEYRVFAAYPFDDRHLLMNWDFWNPDVFSVYLSGVLSQRKMDVFLNPDAEVSEEDRIITLSTGVDGEPQKRYLVQAVLVLQEGVSEQE
mgnify:CR=1 FL=1